MLHVLLPIREFFYTFEHSILIAWISVRVQNPILTPLFLCLLWANFGFAQNMVYTPSVVTPQIIANTSTPEIGQNQGTLNSQIISNLPENTPSNPMSESVMSKRNLNKQDSSAYQRLIRNLGYQVPLFGADFFSGSGDRFDVGSQVPVTDDYLVGPGDQLEIRLWGSMNYQQNTAVDRNGQVYIPQVGSVNVAGVRFKDLKSHLSQAVAQMYRNFNLSVSMGKLRGVQIYVTGQAANPGAYSLNPMSSLVNALLQSGGPSAQGSMRQIELRRGGRLLGTFDLYDLLVKGDKSKDFSLANGDVIYIPAVQNQIALVGVRKPGIYEFTKGETLKDLIKIAGGFDFNTDQNYFHLERMTPDSGLTAQNLAFASFANQALLGGEIIAFGQALEKFSEVVTLRGQVLAPGRMPWKAGMRIKDLIPNAQALLSRDFYQFQNSADLKKSNTITKSDSLLGINWEYAVIERMNQDSLKTELIPFELGKVIFDNDPSQNKELMPGDVITIFNTTDVSVPIAKRPVYVTLEGEVNRVGTYRINPGEKLHDAILKAGGLSPEAYVFGMKFMRRSAAAIQQANYSKVIAEMEKQFESNASEQQASAAGPEAAKAAQEQIKNQRKWFENLKEYKPDGRLVMEFDPELDLSLNDIPNVELENGDRIIIPARPSIVSVFGEVPMQNAFFFHKGNDIGDYVERAGSATQYADESGTFVIRADGSVKSERTTGWLIFGNLSGRNAMPGDAIFVPKNLEYSRWMADLKDWSQVLANFGISAAAIITLMNGVK